MTDTCADFDAGKVMTVRPCLVHLVIGSFSLGLLLLCVLYIVEVTLWRIC